MCSTYSMCSTYRFLVFTLVIVLVGFPSSSCIEYDDIVKIKTVTGDDEESGMNMLGGSFIDLEVFGHYGDSECKIYQLHHAENMGEGDFSPGQKDEFVGPDLQSCDGKTVIWYPGSVSKIRVTHNGEDAWGVKSIAVTFDDQSVVACGNGEIVFVAGRESIDLIC